MTRGIKGFPGGSTVVAPRISALGASIKLSARLVYAPRLDHPPISLIVTALGAFHLNLRRRAEVLLLLTDDDDLVLALHLSLYLYLLGHRLLSPALRANVAPLFMIKGAHCPTVRAEVRFYSSITAHNPEGFY